MFAIMPSTYLICINGSGQPNMRAARALDKKSYKRHLLNQIQNNFMFLMMPYTKIAQMVLLHQQRGCQISL